MAASPPLILDGGLACHLERNGPLHPRLWSAGLLLTDTGEAELTDAHRAFVAQGAAVLLAATYQAAPQLLAAELHHQRSEQAPTTQRKQRGEAEHGTERQCRGEQETTQERSEEEQEDEIEQEIEQQHEMEQQHGEQEHGTEQPRGEQERVTKQERSKACLHAASQQEQQADAVAVAAASRLLRRATRAAHTARLAEIHRSDLAQQHASALHRWWLPRGVSGCAVVLASVGPYGAALADGSEYRGGWGLTPAEYAAFHRPRLDALQAAFVR